MGITVNDIKRIINVGGDVSAYAGLWHKSLKNSPIPSLPIVDRPKPMPIAMDVERVRLADAFATYRRVHRFEPGDLIRPKPGIQIESKREQCPTGTYVVMDVFPHVETTIDPRDLMTYGLRLDIYVGFYDDDGDFIFMPSDSRRYEPLPKDAS